MNFWQVTLGNCGTITLNLIFFIWMSRILLGEIPGRGSRRIALCLLYVLILVPVQSSLGALCYLNGVWSWKYGIGRVLWQYFVLAGGVLFLKLLYQISFRSCVLAAVMAEILCSYGDLLSRLFVYGKYYNLGILEERLQYFFWLFVIQPACLLFCGLVIRKSGMGKIYQSWMEQKKLHKGITAFIVFCPLIYIALETAGKEPEGASLLLPLALLMMTHMILVHVVRDRDQKRYIAAQQASLAQQTIYIEKMEQIQSEIRRFRHDFKNMTAGMYLKAQEADTESLQSFIREVTEDFDRQVGGQVRLLNQLANVHMAEVKGLLLEKLARMQKEEICCELEVLRPFEATRMRSTDLCRCLGILVDNAMDEVRGKKDARIHLMISSQNGCTTFRVKNTLSGSVDFRCLETDGYTTKGKGRGIGLGSYRRLVGQYDFVFPFMAIQDGCFVQELKIQEV